MLINSTLEYPTVISHFTLATEMEQYATLQGYTIFCILPTHHVLPEPPSSSSPMSPLLLSEENNGRWYSMAELLSPSTLSTNAATTSSTSSTTTTANHNNNKVDSWKKLNGTGRRLDGQSHHDRALPSQSASHAVATIDGLTEEEMLQLALQQSMEPTTAPIATAKSFVVSTNMAPGPVPPEPDEGSGIKIQFRFPATHHPPRIVRRFYDTNTIYDIYNYVRSVGISTTTNHNHHNFECMVGYPPKNMLLEYPISTTTIQETNLANATIQVRFL